MTRLLLLTCLLFPVTESRQLVFSNVLFRHGARAPSTMLINSSVSQLFRNGLGELTEDGIVQSRRLGVFLKHRYVDTGFLSTPFRVKEMRMFSRAISRCLITASAVGAGMFTEEGRPDTIIPVFSQEFNDTLLDYAFETCTTERKYIEERCGTVPPFSSFASWPEFEGFVFDCMKLGEKSKFFRNPGDFVRAEALVNEELNGAQLEPELDRDLHEAYGKVYNFILGAGDYHNKQILKMKAGFLVDTVLSNLRIKWSCHTGGRCKKIWKMRRFTAYSTQDWIISSFLEILGQNVTIAAVGNGQPLYNSMVVVELFDNEGKPEVEVHYKSSWESDNLIDVTREVRNCSTSPCPLSVFQNCCNDYITKDPWAACMGK